MSRTYEKLRMVLAGFAASIALTVFSFLSPSISEASIITIDPGAYAEGADLSTVSPFVTLQGVVGARGSYPITARTSTFSGDQVFGSFELGWYDCVGRYECAMGFGMVFRESPDWVSLSIRFTNLVLSHRASISWFAFDAAGDLLVSDYIDTYGHEPGQFSALSVAIPDMKSLVVGGADYRSAGDFERLSFAVGVPEPSGLILSCLGLAGVFLVRRRSEIKPRRFICPKVVPG